MGNKKSISKNSIFNIAYNLVNALLPLIMSMYVSRIIMPEGIGKVSYVNTIVSYFVTVAVLGLPTYGVKAISIHKDDENKKNQTFSELLIINTISTSIVIIVYIAALFAIPQFRNNFLLYVAVGIRIPFSFFNVDWFFRGIEDYAYIALRNISVKVFSSIALFVFVKTKEDYIWYAFILSFASVFNLVYGFFHSRKYVRFTFKSLHPWQHIKSVIVLSVTLVFSTIYDKIDITMLGNMKDDAVVGIYDNAQKIVHVIITVCIAVTGVLLPRISYLYENNREKFLELLNNGIKIICFVSIPATLGLILLSDSAIVLLYGEPFAESADVLKILAAMVMVKGIGDLICYQLIVCIGKEKYFIPVVIASALANIGINAVLIPKFSHIGAAVASVISELLFNGTLFIIAKKYVEFRIDIKNLFKVILSTGIMGAYVFAVSKLFTNNLIICTIGISGGLLLYFVSNILMKNEIIYFALGKIKDKLSR